VSYPISKLITKSFEFSVFPNKLKEAHVIPLYKKSNTLDKGNYRPVSILPVGVMTVEVMSVGEITVGVMTVGVMRRPRQSMCTHE
jgi:hypothetical protein